MSKKTEVLFIMENIAVIFGGRSCEREVSVITGVTCLNALDKKRYNAVPIYLSADNIAYTGESLADLDFYKNFSAESLNRVVLLFSDNTLYIKKKNKLKPFLKIDCAINCCHGGLGENGSLAGVMEFSKIPFVSPSVFAGSLTMDKLQTKQRLVGQANFARHVAVNSGDSVGQCAMSAEELFGYPMLVKPNSLGSSIGVKVVKDLRALTVAVMNALRYDDCVLIEEYLQGATEINCAVYKSGDKIIVSECEKPLPKTEFLTFSDKYSDGEREFPAKILKRLADKIKTTTEKVYKTLSTSGVMRFDYLIVGSKVYLNEINSVPGSLSYYLFGDAPNALTELLTEWIENAKTCNNRKNSLVTDFSGGILSSIHGKGQKTNNGKN